MKSEEKNQNFKQNQKNSHKPKHYNYIKYTSIAFQMIATILLGVIGGIKLDEWIQWQFPVFTVVLTIIGVFLGIYHSIKEFIKF